MLWYGVEVVLLARHESVDHNFRVPILDTMPAPPTLARGSRVIEKKKAGRVGEITEVKGQRNWVVRFEDGRGW